MDKQLSAIKPVTKARMAAPGDLTDPQRAMWDRVVGAKPVDWFGEDSAPLLAEYCRAADMCDRLALLVEAAMAGGDPQEMKLSIELRDKESRRLTTLGTKLRLTQQSRYTPQASATATKKAGNARPWET